MKIFTALATLGLALSAHAQTAPIISLSNFTTDGVTVSWTDCTWQTSGTRTYRLALDGVAVTPDYGTTGPHALTGLGPGALVLAQVACIDKPTPTAAERPYWGASVLFGTVGAPVAPDTVAPVLTRIGADPVSVTQGGSYTSPGWTCADAVDGAIVPTVNTSAVNTAAVGSYTETADCQDAAGNDATQGTRLVNVTAAANLDNWADASTDSNVIMAMRGTAADWAAFGSVGSQNTRCSVWENADNVSHNANVDGFEFAMRDEDGTSSGSISCWVNADESDVPVGVKQCIQFTEYTPAYWYSHLWEGTGYDGGTKSAGSKHLNYSTRVSSNTTSEVVWEHSLQRGYPIVYHRNDNGDFDGVYQNISGTGCPAAPDIRHQPLIDNGVIDAGDNCADSRARYGGLYGFSQLGTSSYGDKDPLTGAIEYPQSGWMTYDLCVTANNYGGFGNHVEAWLTKPDMPRTKIVDNNNIELGSPRHDGFHLLPYRSTGTANIGGRDDTFVIYKDVILRTGAPVREKVYGPDYGANTGPEITAMSAGTPGSTTATITGTTHVAATCVAEWGIGGFGSTSSATASGTSHSVALTGLTASSTYNYRLACTDGATSTLRRSGEREFVTTSAGASNPTATFIDAMASNSWAAWPAAVTSLTNTYDNVNGGAGTGTNRENFLSFSGSADTDPDSGLLFGTGTSGNCCGGTNPVLLLFDIAESKFKGVLLDFTGDNYHYGERVAYNPIDELLIFGSLNWDQVAAFDWSTAPNLADANNNGQIDSFADAGWDAWTITGLPGGNDFGTTSATFYEDAGVTLAHKSSFGSSYRVTNAAGTTFSTEGSATTDTGLHANYLYHSGLSGVIGAGGNSHSGRMALITGAAGSMTADQRTITGTNVDFGFNTTQDNVCEIPGTTRMLLLDRTGGSHAELDWAGGNTATSAHTGASAPTFGSSIMCWVLRGSAVNDPALMVIEATSSIFRVFVYKP